MEHKNAEIMLGYGVVFTLGLVLIPWAIYRVLWSLAARKPKTYTHTHVITPDTSEWPLVPGDV